MPRFRKSLLLCSSLLVLSAPALAAGERDAPLWSPVVDFSFKSGNERSLGTVSLMVPFAQDTDTLVFADLRMVLSDQDTFEGNMGLGLRQITEPGVILGGYAFWDSRASEHDNTFQQATIGVEAIGEKWDGRFNLYTPVGEDEKLAYADPAGISLVGTRLYAQDGRVFETSLRGFDIEFGHALPLLENVRGYGGYYRFHGDHIEPASGYRARIEADLGEWVEIGAEKQFAGKGEDAVFGEIRVRYPFDGWLEGSKRRRAMSPLQRRMMTPIVRDIDIVIKAKPKPEPVPVKTANGEAANIYFVDNTAKAGGNGTKARPFNALAEAEAAAGAYDTIYVLEGDGTTANQNAGIALDKNGQRLLGSGTALTIDTARLRAPEGVENFDTVNLFVLARAKSAPVITNTGGDGITVTGDNAEIAGLTVDGAADDNIYIENANGALVRNVTLTDAADEGLEGLFDGNGSYAVTVRDSVARDSGDAGILLQSQNDSRLSTTVSGNSVDGSGGNGIYLLGVGNSALTGTVTGNSSSGGNVGIYLNSQGTSVLTGTVSGNIATGNAAQGIRLQSRDASALTGTVSGNDVENNTSIGIYLLSQTNSTLTSTVSGNVVENNTSVGIQLLSQGDSALTGTVSGNTATGNTTQGIRLQSQNDSALTGTVSGNVAENNNNVGIWLFSQTNSVLTGTVNGNVAENNNNIGVLLQSQHDSALTGTVSGNVVENNNNVGIYLFSLTNSTLTGTVSGNAVSGNALNGVFVDDDSTVAMQADLGGGALGGAGGNAISGNTGTEIWVDLNGLELKAENNWWGDAAGLQPGETTLDGASTIDADPFLTAAP